MSEKESDKNYVIATCRVPRDLHTEVSRKMAGTVDSFQSIFLEALKDYLRRDRKMKLVKQSDVPENARVGAAILAMLERWKNSPDAHMSGFMVGNIELLLRLANEEDNQ